MKRAISAALVILGAQLLLSAVASEASAAGEPEPRTLSSKISAVTVFSDRARVTRSATVELRTTPVMFVLEKLPGWVDDGTVRVALSPPDAGRIVDVRVKRDYLARASDEAYREAEASVAELAARVAALDDELKVLAAQARQIEAIRAFSLEKVAKDSTLGDVSVERFKKVVTYISESLRETGKARRAVVRERTKLAPELQARQRELEELKNLAQLEETSVFVTLKGARRAEAALDLTYMLPGATWEPAHELRAMGAEPRSAEISSYAVVTQTSGEDWENAKISFATQSSSATIRIPQLEALTLGDTHTATRIMESRISSFTRAKQAFEGQNRIWNKLQQRKSSMRDFERVYEDNFQYLQVVQSKTVEMFASLQRRGTTAHFSGLARATVRGDGYSVRVPIGKTVLAATQKIVAAPEQSLNAARTLRMVNAGSQALLPGKVALYLDGSFLGMTDLDFVADGEEFAVFLGVADHIKLSRVLDRKHSSVVRKKRTRMQVAYVVTVENLADERASLDLADRVPVSEDKAISIDRIRISPKAKPDSKGLLKWSLTLQPGEKRAFRIAYRLEYPPTLVLRPRPARRRMHSPAAPAPSADDQLHEQILELEQAL